MKKFFASLLFSAALLAHPMGNFSVSHFSELRLTRQGVELQYVLDLAEIPTFELLRTWQVNRSASPELINEKATRQAQEWLTHLNITVNGRPVRAKFESVKATIADGAGNLPIIRMDMRAQINSSGGALRYEDGNYPERAGWKEIVVAAENGAALTKASQSDVDLSKALTQYPPDPTVAPPQDLRAELEWRTEAPLVASNRSKSKAQDTALHRTPAPAEPTVVTSIPQPHTAPAAVAPATLTAQGAPAGSVTRGDFLSRLLHRRKLSLSMILIALAASFGLGAAHALTPGHGKAIVAAYLVGAKGTLKHAAFLGAMVTFTHTITVFALGLATLFLFRFIVPEKITVYLGALSGLSIIAVGAFMLHKRIRQAGYSQGHTHVHASGHVHEHSRAHDHEGVHSHPHTHAHVGAHSRDEILAHSHSHSHSPVAEPVHAAVPDHSHEHHHHSQGAHAHSHSHSHGPGGHGHSHVPRELSWAGLVALGASGGLVPCESALVLLLGAIALGRVGLGLLLLLSFSLGLALVLMLVGVLVLYAKTLLPERTRSSGHPFFRWAAIASPAIVMIVGFLMTAASLGWIRSKWMIG